MRQSDPTKESDIERQLEAYRRDPLYRFTEGEARELADEVLRLRAEVAHVTIASQNRSGA